MTMVMICDDDGDDDDDPFQTGLACFAKWMPSMNCYAYVPLMMMMTMTIAMAMTCYDLPFFAK